MIELLFFMTFFFNYNLLINIRDTNKRTNLGNTYFDNI
jgi:hypothetical protein